MTPGQQNTGEIRQKQNKMLHESEFEKVSLPLRFHTEGQRANMFWILGSEHLRFLLMA